jgi:hypothetical protein
MLHSLRSIVCLTTDPQPLPKRAIHSLRSSAYSFNFQYILLSLRPSGSCLRLLLRLPVTYILPTIFPSITILEGSAYVKYENYAQVLVKLKNRPVLSPFIYESNVSAIKYKNTTERNPPLYTRLLS